MKADLNHQLSGCGDAWSYKEVLVSSDFPTRLVLILMESRQRLSGLSLISKSPSGKESDMKIVFVNNDGAGISEAIEVRDGLTLEELHSLRGTRRGLSCTVSGTKVDEYLDSDLELQDGDKVVVAPTKVDAAR